MRRKERSTRDRHSSSRKRRCHGSMEKMKKKKMLTDTDPTTPEKSNTSAMTQMTQVTSIGDKNYLTTTTTGLTFQTRCTRPYTRNQDDLSDSEYEARPHTGSQMAHNLNLQDVMGSRSFDAGSNLGPEPDFNGTRCRRSAILELLADNGSVAARYTSPYSCSNDR
jgi:hypothetical protein